MQSLTTRCFDLILQHSHKTHFIGKWDEYMEKVRVFKKKLLRHSERKFRNAFIQLDYCHKAHRAIEFQIGHTPTKKELLTYGKRALNDIQQLYENGFNDLTLIEIKENLGILLGIVDLVYPKDMRTEAYYALNNQWEIVMTSIDNTIGILGRRPDSDTHIIQTWTYTEKYETLYFPTTEPDKDILINKVKGFFYGFGYQKLKLQ